MELFNTEDGYINVTKLCQKAGKDINAWKINKSTQLYIKELINELKISEQKLIYSIKGGDIKLQGTFAHQLLATHIAQWCSAKFAVKIALWIEEWKLQQNNKEKYHYELKNLKSDNCNEQIEKKIQSILYEKHGGKIEVETEYGYIDLLTDTEIIEIKNGENWKHGMGQIIVYGEYYPKHQKRLHLFDININNKINEICKKYDIIVTYE